MSAVFLLARGLQEASLMALFGSAALLLLLAAKVPELAQPNQILARGRRLAALVALVSSALRPALAGAATFGALAGDLLAVRVALLLGLALTVWRNRVKPGFWIAGLCLVLIAATSHAAAASPGGFGAIGAASDAIHLLTGGYWIGSLCVLAVLLGSNPAAPRLGLALSVFAEWGMLSVALLVMTGMINAAMVLLGNPGHDAPFYLAILGTKLTLVGMMIALALVNHFRLLPRLTQEGVTARLKRQVGWELGLGLAVIALAMILTASAPTLQ